jgi:hypothetical protein
MFGAKVVRFNFDSGRNYFDHPHPTVGSPVTLWFSAFCR